jgi:hypothetical protein
MSPRGVGRGIISVCVHRIQFPRAANFSSSARRAGMSPQRARFVHQRPAFLLERDWRSSPSYQAEGQDGRYQLSKTKKEDAQR